MMNQASITEFTSINKTREALIKLMLRIGIIIANHSELKRKLGSILNDSHLPSRAKSVLSFQYLYDLL